MKQQDDQIGEEPLRVHEDSLRVCPGFLNVISDEVGSNQGISCETSSPTSIIEVEVSSAEVPVAHASSPIMRVVFIML